MNSLEDVVLDAPRQTRLVVALFPRRVTMKLARKGITAPFIVNGTLT